MLLREVRYLPNFLLPPSSTWILSSSAKQGGSEEKQGMVFIGENNGIEHTQTISNQKLNSLVSVINVFK